MKKLIPSEQQTNIIRPSCLNEKQFAIIAVSSNQPRTPACLCPISPDLFSSQFHINKKKKKKDKKRKDIKRLTEIRVGSSHVTRLMLGFLFYFFKRRTTESKINGWVRTQTHMKD